MVPVCLTVKTNITFRKKPLQLFTGKAAKANSFNKQIAQIDTLVTISFKRNKNESKLYIIIIRIEIK